MKKILHFLALAFIVFFTACTESQVDKEQKIIKEHYTQVMAIHDEAMPWMDDIFRLKEELSNLFDNNLENLILGSEANIISINICMEELDLADEAMMQWMRNFKSEMPQDWTLEQKIEYLNTEKQNITVVREQMKNAITQAENLRNSL